MKKQTSEHRWDGSRTSTKSHGTIPQKEPYTNGLKCPSVEGARTTRTVEHRCGPILLGPEARAIKMIPCTATSESDNR